MTVQGTSFDGEAVTIDRAFKVKRNLSSEGRLQGQVINTGFADAEVTGSVGQYTGSGEWQTVRGAGYRGISTMERQSG